MKTILLIDDFRISNELLETDLKEAGYHVISTQSAASGIRALSEYTVDLVLSDYAMPGMNGLEFCREIRSVAKAQAPPVIILSVHYPPSQDELQAHNIAHWVRKPYKKDQLIEIVDSLLK